MKNVSHAKRLTREQKIMLADAGLDPADYLLVKASGPVLTLHNRNTQRIEYFEKTERRKGK